MTNVFEIVSCPFCKSENYDLVGLKQHFEKGYCDVYNIVEDLEAEQKEEYLKNDSLVR